MALFPLSGVLRGFHACDGHEVRLGIKPLCGLAQRKNCSFPNFSKEKIHKFFNLLLSEKSGTKNDRIFNDNS